MRALAVALVWMLALSARGEAPVSVGWFDRVAIGGMDVVAYHTPEARKTHRAAPGSGQHVVRWRGAEWRFASAESAARFAADPERFAPEFGGFCANALSLGEGLISTDGSVWEFFGDDLYLFYAERGRQRWLNGPWRDYLRQAKAAWQAILTR